MDIAGVAAAPVGSGARVGRMRFHRIVPLELLQVSLREGLASAPRFARFLPDPLQGRGSKRGLGCRPGVEANPGLVIREAGT